MNDAYKTHLAKLESISNIDDNPIFFYGFNRFMQNDLSTKPIFLVDNTAEPSSARLLPRKRKISDSDQSELLALSNEQLMDMAFELAIKKSKNQLDESELLELRFISSLLKIICLEE